MENKTQEYNTHDIIINTILADATNPKFLKYENDIKQDIIECCEIVHTIKYNICTYDTIDCIEGQLKEEIDYTCCICMNLFKEPMMLPCGHSLCNDCVFSCKQKCPLCRKYFLKEQLISNKSITELINKLIVKCNYCGSNHEMGYKCTYIIDEFNCKRCYSNKMSLSEFVDHYMACCFSICQYCYIHELQFTIRNHEDECSKRYARNIYRSYYRYESYLNKIDHCTLSNIFSYLDYKEKNNIRSISKKMYNVIIYRPCVIDIPFFENDIKIYKNYNLVLLH
jgi:hypothetical protein